MIQIAEDIDSRNCTIRKAAFEGQISGCRELCGFEEKGSKTEGHTE